MEPSELVAAALGPQGAFLSLYGDAPLLCIELRDSSAAEVRAGLAASLNPESPDGPRMLGFHTELAFEPLQATTTSKPAFSASDVSRLLARGRHFAIPVIKRSSGTLSEERITVGRARNADVVLRDASISKLHAWFELDEGGAVKLADAGSKNGTRLRGEPLFARALEQVDYGDPIVFGSISAFLCEPLALWEAFQGSP